MIYILIAINTLVAFWSYINISSSKYDRDFEKLFNESFPKFAWIKSILFLINLSSFAFLGYSKSSENILANLDFSKTLIIIISTLFLSFFIIQCCREEIFNVKDEIKNKREFLVPSIILFIISSSFFIGFVFVLLSTKIR